MFVLCACMIFLLVCKPACAYVCIVCLFDLVLVCKPVCAYVGIVSLYELVLICKPVCFYICFCVFV